VTGVYITGYSTYRTNLLEWIRAIRYIVYVVVGVAHLHHLLNLTITAYTGLSHQFQVVNVHDSLESQMLLGKPVMEIVKYGL
jgi:hypothetical protein